jgi:hypothetical protein
VNTYRISCFSKCGSYFQPYLKAVAVNAITEKDAVRMCKEWLEHTGREFIYPESEWTIRDITVAQNSGVVDFFEDSDY